MSALKKTPASVRANGSYKSAPPSTGWAPAQQFSLEKVRELVAELEVPFHPSQVEWRVMTVSEDRTRGQIMPYADQRAYTDRLNELFTPAGWTRRYTVHTSANFERSEDKKIVAKVFVTCDLTIHGIGSHSATGEEWADDDNAGTSAEAQAFKRACSCFGLGRYLYYFGGVWVDLDGRERPKEAPELFGWATPEGWRKGLRPPQRDDSQSVKSAAGNKRKSKGAPRQDQNVSPEGIQMIQQIEAMAEPLGKAMYRGLLKGIARVWKPADIQDRAVLKQVLSAMQSAARGLSRLEAAQEKTSVEELKEILSSLKIRSVEQVDNLETLRQLVTALEQKTD
jgi:hypothetical protein